MLLGEAMVADVAGSSNFTPAPAKTVVMSRAMLVR